MWIEDTDSIRAKIDLINQYELAGSAFWEKDRENEEIWNLVEEKLPENSEVTRGGER